MAETGAPPSTGGTGLRSKLYGVPLWGWMGIAGAAAIVIGLWLQSRKKAAPAPTMPTDTSAFAGPDTGQWEAIMAQIRDLQGKPSTTPTTTPATNEFENNAAWYKAALAWFGRQPNYAGTTPMAAQIALNDYLQGKPLGLWEQWTVNTVITGTNQKGQKFEKGIGSPPEQFSTKFG